MTTKATTTLGRSTRSAAGATPAFESLEQRQHLSTSILDSKIKVAMLTGQDGTGIASSRVTVQFSTPITLLDTSKFRMFGYKIDTTSANLPQKKQTIGITSVEAGADGNKLVFTTDRRVRKGGQLIVYAGAVADGDGAATTSDLLAKLPKGLNKERFTLGSRAFAPSNLVYFNNSTYSGAPAVTATPTAPSDQTVLSELTTYLDTRITKGTLTSEQKTAVLASYNDPTIQTIVPNSNLRAALVSLTGTVGEAAISTMTTANNPTGKAFTVVDFSTEVSGGAVVAETKISPQTGRLRTLFKTSLKGEPFQVLAAYLAHEALHTDSSNGQNEEIFANYVQATVYAQNLLTQGAIALRGTQLVTDNNTLLLSVLNSGDALYPRVGANDAPLLGTQNVFPNANVPADTYTSFEDYVRTIYAGRNFANVDTNAPAVATTYSNLITGRSDAGTFKFSTDRIDLFDNSQQIITDRGAILIAAAMRLATS